MTTWDQLPPEQRVEAQTFMSVLRPLMGEIDRVLNRLQTLEDAWAGGVSAIFDSLDPGSEIADEISLAGAKPVPKESVVQTMTDFGQAMMLFYAAENRQRYIAYAGLANVIAG